MLLEAVRQDDTLLRDMEIERLPGEKVFCKDLEHFGTVDVLDALNKTTAYTAEWTLLKIQPEDIQIEYGFIRSLALEPCRREPRTGRGLNLSRKREPA